MMYQVTARNFSDAHENKIHSDDIARRYGFRGALVPGVAVWGHLTHPFVARHGAEWLASAHVATRFHKPAYHDDRLTIGLVDGEEGQAVATCHDDGGQLLAEVHAPPLSDHRRLPEQPENPFDTAPSKDPGRVEMRWASVLPRHRFADWHVQFDAAENERWASEVEDRLEVYRGARGAVHPHWLLAIANQALTREYVMPAWIHVGSEIRFHRLLRVGDEVTVRTLVEEKWERKGHQFLRTYGTYLLGGAVTTEVSHTAIFRVAD